MGVSRWTVLAATVLAAAGLTPVLVSGASGAAAVAGGCAATAHVDAQWGDGQVVTVTVVNTAATAATRWAVSWTPTGGQRVVSAWNAAVTTANGSITAANASWNGALAPGASTTFGMQLAGTGAAPTPSCTNDATPSGGVYATVADNGATLTLTVGQTLVVTLPVGYLPPTATGGAVVPEPGGGGWPTGQPIVARFDAVAPGTAELRSQSDDPCFHTTPPCARPVQQWLLHVTVVPAAGRTVTVGSSDNAGSVTLHIGDTLVVSLPAMYVPPTAVPAGVLAAAGTTGGYPTGQALVARYTAVAAGRADVSTISDAACIHEPLPCPSPQVPWRLHVTVA
ncbi:cellulose binding domain-containing protein [Dactylosporangium vinaceum]|uniref:Cellulose binding domain-containing protein n=1 Tax=Dactylosporangium vinaceum TaxID=53362 RepID=A0ABV5M9G3_9ACTN|nr:cellulose binding domain-containing protein [Dactylosporangium vinaceum]UAB99973.1 cellulose binding domain-containing protein [Dactylosporangium vinaceum]